jgi:hypothetical protein
LDGINKIYKIAESSGFLDRRNMKDVRKAGEFLIGLIRLR